MSANGIAHLVSKQLKQVGKLNIAEAKRQGKTVAADGTISGSVNTGATSYRARNTLDASQLPTRYHASSNTGALVNNANTGGLVAGRPWT